MVTPRFGERDQGKHVNKGCQLINKPKIMMDENKKNFNLPKEDT